MITAIGDIVRTILWAMINNALGDADFWSLFAPVATINLVLLVIIYVSRSWWIQLAALCGSLILTHFSVGFWYISTTLGGSP